MNSSQSFTVISLCIFDIVYLSIRNYFLAIHLLSKGQVKVNYTIIYMHVYTVYYGLTDHPPGSILYPIDIYRLYLCFKCANGCGHFFIFNFFNEL